MSHPESIARLSTPPQNSDGSDVKWIIPENNHEAQRNESLQQWNEFPPPNIMPVTSSTGSQSVFSNAQHGVSNTHVHGSSNIHGISSISNGFSNGNYTSPNGGMNNLNGLILPNGSRIPNGSISNGGNFPTFRPRAPNGTVVGTNSWPIPNPSAGRFVRPWNGTMVKPGGARKPKRIRTAFTSQQMIELELEYARTRYLDRTRRIELAEYLHLNERTIKIWFQNRRMKEKKDKAESLEEEEATSTTDSSSEVGLPLAVSGQMPMEGLYHREVYLDQYSVTTMSNSMQNMQVSLQQASSSMMNGYPTYPPEEYESRRPHDELLGHPSMYNEQVLEIIEESPRPHEGPSDSNNTSIGEQNWDLSWIKSIEIIDDDDC